MFGERKSDKCTSYAGPPSGKKAKASTHPLGSEVLIIFPDVGAPLKFAINRYGIQVPTSTDGNVTPSIVVDQIAPYAAVSSAFEKSTGVDFGFAVDAWRPNPFFSGSDVHGQHVGNVFTGIDVDVAIRNSNAIMDPMQIPSMRVNV